ncbi:hypothetical protein HOP50_04g31350 [Chloropicon primus]|nr:hypothetical protein HOP50_04g31350 [Chloropicon primus]
MIDKGLEVAQEVLCGPCVTQACSGRESGLVRCGVFLLAIVLSGPILFLCGVSFLFQTASYTRENAVKAYNNQVGVWQSTVYDSVFPQGAYMNMTTTFKYSCVGGSTLNGKEDLYNLTLGMDPEDYIVDKNKEDVEDLSPQYKYFYERQQSPASTRIENCDITVTVRSNSSSLVTVTVPYLTTELVKCDKRDTYKACQDVLYLSDFCTKVKYYGGKYVLDRNFPGQSFGCFYNSDTNRFDMTRYQRNEEPIFMNLMMRFSADPYLTYMEETDGTGDFGLDTEGKVKLGAILLAFGVLICVVEIHTFKQIRGFVRQMNSSENTMRPSHPVQRFYYDSAHYYYNRRMASHHHRHANRGMGGVRGYGKQHQMHHNHRGPATSYPRVNNRSSFGVYQPYPSSAQHHLPPGQHGYGQRIDNPIVSPCHNNNYPPAAPSGYGGEKPTGYGEKPTGHGPGSGQSSEPVPDIQTYTYNPNGNP